MKIRENSGFSLLEMLIAMSMIAIVLAFSLMLMGDGLRKAVKANAVVTASALAQYEIDYAKNIAFPPTTVERAFKNYDTNDDAVDDDGEYQACSYNSSYEVWVLSAVDTSENIYTITVKVRDADTDALLTELQTYISRNGEI